MAQSIDSTQVVAALGRAAARLVELRDYLTEMDAAIGDGDMGINLAKGGLGLQRYLAANEPGDDLGRFIAGAGMAFNREAPSTMGTLIATGMMRAGKEARGASVLDTDLLARMLTAAEAGMQERGKAKPGDKTILDALDPAAKAFAAAIERGDDLAAASQAMLKAARQGRDAAIPLQSKVGRASWVGERTRDKPDPGTVMLVQVLEAVLGAEHTEPGSSRS